MYIFTTSERNNDKATEYETKSLLYLLTKVKKHKKIDLFIIDCFNDLTGTTNACSDAWDVQSKGVSSLTPNTIGKALYTLWVNYDSEIQFGHYILFMPPLKLGYLSNESAEVFTLDNFIDKEKLKVKKGLQVEIKRRQEIDELNDEKFASVEAFLPRVIFVTNRYEKSDYIKGVIQFKNIKNVDDTFLIKIFEEIRAMQSAKKICNVNGQTVANLKEALKFNKNIYRRDIEMLIVNRLVGNDIFSAKGVPIYFLSEIREMEIEDIADLIQHCQARISKTLFNKNNKKYFWLFLESVIIIAAEAKDKSIHDIYNKIDSNIKSKIFLLDEPSMLYFIALVKEGLR